MDVLKAMKGRRSIRAFKDNVVSDETVEKLIEAACWAPSAGNIQPWQFIVVRDEEMKRKLAEAALGQHFIEEAPVVVIVCADPQRSAQRYGDRGEDLYCIQDTAAAAQNLHLYAYSLGLGTCWVGAFDEEKVSQALGVSGGIRPMAVIPLGRPAEHPLPRKRRVLKEVMRYERY